MFPFNDLPIGSPKKNLRRFPDIIYQCLPQNFELKYYQFETHLSIFAISFAMFSICEISPELSTTNSGCFGTS